MELLATEVFGWTWDAIHDLDDKNQRKYRYIIHEGSSRSSKTYSIIDTFDLYARQNMDKRLTVWRDTKTDCKKTVLNDAKKHLARTGRWLEDHRFNKTESILEYNTRSTFEIHGTDDEETVHGLTQDVAWLNEPYKISRDTFDQIDQRTSDFIIVDWNPKKAHWIDDLKKDPRALVIKSTFNNNPFCPPEQRRKILSYKPVALTDAVVLGLKTEGQIRTGDIQDLGKDLFEDAVMCLENETKLSADAYKWSVYGRGEKAERPNRIYKWTKIPLHQYQDIPDTHMIYGNDWGVVDPWGIAEVKYFDGALYVHEKNYLSENEIRAKLSMAELYDIQLDEEGLVMRHFNMLGIGTDRIIACDTNRPNKIRALRSLGYDYAVAAVKGPINDGIDLLLNMPVYYTDCSSNIEYEQENYSREVDRYGVVLDKPEDEDNHLMDCIRYAAQYFRFMGIINKV